MKLLVVDDNKYVVTGVQHQIDWESLGITRIFGAYNTRQAREIIKNESIDLLLVDIEMPEEDGFGLIEWIREQELPIRIVILTSFAEYAYAEKAIQYHVFSYMLKPVSDEKLMDVFQNLISAERRRRDDADFAEVGKRRLSDEIVSDTTIDSSPENTKKVIEDVQEYIRSNLRYVTRSDISARFFLSPDYLSRIFKRECGLSLNEYIQRERMLMAKALLSHNSGLSIGQIADRVGYTSFAHFSKQFHKYIGISPSDYKKGKY